MTTLIPPDLYNLSRVNYTFAMWTRRSTGLGLSLLLLLTSVAGLASHDHATATAHEELECAILHDGHELTVTTVGDSPSWAAAAEPHHHLCVGCQAKAQRSLLADSLAVAFGTSLEDEDAHLDELSPRSSLIPSPRSLRGPPVA